jgi:hypothetical protein
VCARHRAVAIAMTSAALLVGASIGPPRASAAVNFSPRYWQLLDRYASVELSVEYTGAPFRGVYYSNPAAPPEECEEACGDLIAVSILRPDGSLSTTGWIEVPAAPDGWREVTSTDCQAVGWLDFAHPNWWVCWGIGYL